MNIRLFVLFILLFPIISFSAPKRIEKDVFDRSKVKKINISFGKVQILKFPDFIEEFHPGLPDLYTVERCKNHGDELIVRMRVNTLNPSNLFVQTRGRKRYMLDLVVEPRKHQGIYEVTSSHYSTEHSDSSLSKTILITPEFNVENKSHIKPVFEFKSKMKNRNQNKTRFKKKKKSKEKLIYVNKGASTL